MDRVTKALGDSVCHRLRATLKAVHRPVGRIHWAGTDAAEAVLAAD